MPTPRQEPLAVTLRKRGVKTFANSARELSFVGKNAGRSYRDLAVALAGRFTETNTDVAAIGEFYDNSVYQVGSSKARDYEEVYADFDWTAAALDPLAKQALQDAFGDNATDTSTSRVDVESLRTILGAPKTVSAVNGLAEVQLGLTSAQDGTTRQSDEDTRGIRGVEDADAPLEPVV